MINNRPWKVMADCCCVKDYKSKSAAIKRAKILKRHTSECEICVSSGFEVIDI